MKKETVTLNDGNTMPVIGLGTSQLKGTQAKEVVARALKIGYRLIDTAVMYNNARQIGEAIKSSDVNRNELFIVTKLMPSQIPHGVTERLQDHLKELQLEYVDLLLIHWPPMDGNRIDMWQGLEGAQKQGLCRSIGVSNYDIEYLDEMLEEGTVRPAVNQIEFNPFVNQNQLFRYCLRRNIAVMAYSPLTRAHDLSYPLLERIAENHHKSTAQVLLRWSIATGAIPIPKATSAEHLQENWDAQMFNLTDSELDSLDHLVEYHYDRAEFLE